MREQEVTCADPPPHLSFPPRKDERNVRRNHLVNHLMSSQICAPLERVLNPVVLDTMKPHQSCRKWRYIFLHLSRYLRKGETKQTRKCYRNYYSGWIFLLRARAFLENRLLDLKLLRNNFSPLKNLEGFLLRRSSANIPRQSLTRAGQRVISLRKIQESTTLETS